MDESKNFTQVTKELCSNPKRWLVTGATGFIGSNIVEFLLKNNQFVIGIDNMSTGFMKNLEEVFNKINRQQNDNFLFVEGDIRSLDICKEVCEGVDYVLHQAALGSIPRSIDNPVATNESNVSGFVNLLVAAKDMGVKSFTYASSSAIYGDSEYFPKVEDKIGALLSPYTVSKYINELYAGNFARVYNFKSIGLRYFNIFGPRQDPNGAYAAVIPRWIDSMLQNTDVYIYGDGENTRDFCFVEDVIQANILAAIAAESAKDQIYNVGLGDSVNLNQLFLMIQKSLNKLGVTYTKLPIYTDIRVGDIKHSQARISKAIELLNYNPLVSLEQGVEKTVNWYIDRI